MNNSVDDPIGEALRREALRIEEDCMLSSKRHFNTADSWKWLHYGLGVPAALAAAGAGASGLGNEAIAAGALGAASAFLSALMTFLKSGETSAAVTRASALASPQY